MILEGALETIKRNKNHIIIAMEMLVKRTIHKPRLLIPTCKQILD